MTDAEKAIVMAYTGYAMLAGDKLGLFYGYVQQLMGRPVWTHELAQDETAREIQERARPDFLKLCADQSPDAGDLLRVPECWAVPHLLNEEQLRRLPVGAVVWREYSWTDEDAGRQTTFEPVMRSTCCGTAVLADGESQTAIDDIQRGLDAEGNLERYWSARPPEKAEGRPGA